MNVFLALDSRTSVVGGVENLVGESLTHGVLFATAGKANQPPDGEGAGPTGRHLDRYLIGGATDAARANLDIGPDVVYPPLENGDGVLSGAALDDFEGVVDDLAGDVLLARPEDLIDHLADKDVAEYRVGLDLSLLGRSSSHLLLPLGPVAGASLLAVLHAGGVEGAPDDLVPDAGEVADAAPADQHDRVLLEVVALAGDVGSDLDPVGETHAANFAKSRVGLLRGDGVHAGADPPSLGSAGQCSRLRFLQLWLPAFADKLLDRRHVAPASEAESGENARLRAQSTPGRERPNADPYVG